MLTRRILISVMALAGVFAVPARASTTYYIGAGSEAAFNTARGGLTLQTFLSSDLLSGGLYNANGTGVSFLGFNGASPADFNVNGVALQGTVGGEQVKITFPANVVAFGLHFTSNVFGNWCVAQSETSTSSCNTTIVTPGSQAEFFGVISTAPLTTSLFMTSISGSPTIVISNFEVGTSVSETPEPATLGMIGVGLLILPLIRRRRQRRDDSQPDAAP